MHTANSAEFVCRPTQTRPWTTHGERRSSLLFASAFNDQPESTLVLQADGRALPFSAEDFCLAQCRTWVNVDVEDQLEAAECWRAAGGKSSLSVFTLTSASACAALAKVDEACGEPVYRPSAQWGHICQLSGLRVSAPRL